MFSHSKSSHLVVVRNGTGKAGNDTGSLRFAVSSRPLAGIIFSRLGRNPLSPSKTDTVITVPRGWNIVPDKSGMKIKSHDTDMPIYLDQPGKTKSGLWFVISNGRFAVQINNNILREVLSSLEADVVMVNADYGLQAYREKLRFVSEEKIVSCRRYYSDLAEPTLIGTDWPHHVFIKVDSVDAILPDRALPCAFADFLERCSSKSLKLCAINVAGIAMDLETTDGLLGLCKIHLDCLSDRNFFANGGRIYTEMPDTDTKTFQKARLVGKILLGDNIQLGSQVVIAGPAVICDNAVIGRGTVINSSIIGPGTSVGTNQFLFKQVVRQQQSDMKSRVRGRKMVSGQIMFDALERFYQADDEFKTWPFFSYVRVFKPIADYVASLIVLILFAPVFPFIALAIKLSSPGPVFFKDRRQGKGGREFFCLKFRTMIVGADKIQDKLRFVNQLDGPQFKIPDDPRISTVGRFLRDTCIDEIPQFLNVLFGQMSIVGPRPSPRAENTMCPSWRYARLSVRPGITGLWQVCRTRQPMKDFQEWIYYDTKYVQNLSLKMDLWICWRTARHLALNFIRQF